MAKLKAFLQSCVATPANIVLTALTLVLLATTLPEPVSYTHLTLPTILLV